ncbi:uncharacterized protein LOC136043068 isoform X2 [Artemia franciscana]|uniref:uncharacterized protein LOC136043068 isoform X2 n=1 Tax=Artemia franciscana TaxID=6661 RepID=UPI0032DAFB92
MICCRIYRLLMLPSFKKVQRRQIFQVIGTEKFSNLPPELVKQFGPEKIAYLKKAFGLEGDLLMHKLKTNRSLARAEIFEIERSFQLLKDWGYAIDDISQNVGLTGVAKEVLLYRHGFLTELGASEIPIHFLRSVRFGFPTRHAKVLLSIDPSLSWSDKIQEKFPVKPSEMKDLKNEENFGIFSAFCKKVYDKAICHLLEKYANIDARDHWMFFERYERKVKLLSIEALEDKLKLMHSLKLPSKMFLSGAFDAHPQVVRSVMSSHPILCSWKFEDLLRMSDKFWSISEEKIRVIQNILDEYKISAETCAQDPTLFLLSPTRLNKILSNVDPEELQFLRNSSDFVKMLSNPVSFVEPKHDQNIAETIHERLFKIRGDIDPTMSPFSSWYISSMLSLSQEEINLRIHKIKLNNIILSGLNIGEKVSPIYKNNVCWPNYGFWKPNYGCKLWKQNTF